MFREYLINGKEPNKGAINFSDLLDAPAGKHGFLKGRDGGLFFDDGTKLRIVGTSMVGAGCTPTHEVAEVVAERVASSGLNLVRMHYADGVVVVENQTEEQDGIRLIDYAKGSSRELNEEAMDRLDYFVNELKKRGVYVQLDTFVGRNWMPEGDGLDYPETFPAHWAPKQANIFNRRMIDLQKEYQTKLLTHKNKYTGLAYVDDPAIAVVQMMNEDSLLWDFGANFNMVTLPPSYMKELKEKWRVWLKKKYNTNEALREAWTDMTGACSLQISEHVDYMIQVPTDPYNTYKIVGAEHDAPQDSLNSQTRMSDYVDFLIELENAFCQEINTHLRGIGVKCGINTTNLIRGAANIYTSTRNCDVQQQDAYYNHPYLGFAPPAKVTQKPMVEVDPRAMIGQQFTSTNLISQNATAQVDGMPLVIAEWNDVSATPFDADAMLEMTAYGSLQDWDGMCNFMYNQDDQMKGLEHQDLHFYFTIYNDPAKWGQIGISSHVFQKELIQKAKNNVYICFTADDIKANVDAAAAVPYASLPYFCRVAVRFSDDGSFVGGDNDVIVSGGYTPTGDYTGAAHAVVFSESPYADLHHKAEGLAVYLDKHREADAQPFFGMGDIGAKRLVINEGKTISRCAYAYGDAITEAMRRWGLLSAEQGIVDGKYFNSDTGEISMCPQNGTFSVSTEQFAAFAGHPQQTEKVGNVRFEITNKVMAISMLSRDGKALTDSDYVLLTAIGETTNEGMRFEGDWLVDMGHAPVLVDQIEGRMVIENAKKSLRVYALAPNGERGEELPVSFDCGNAVVDFGTQNTAIHFELRS